jgi:acyl-coenzyme A synthetase/AMP-(fatty) acid ligase/acyl carrier protein
MIYTSGSTGRPKGALNTHRGIRNRLLWMQREYRLAPDDVVLQKTPFSFDVSVWELFWPLLAGARLLVARPGGHQDPAYLVRLVADEGVTTLHFVPSMLQAFLEQKDLARCTGLRRVICSGEALPHDLQQRFFSRMPSGVELHNLYGPTEAAVDVTFWRCAPEAPRVPIGRPVSNTRIHLLDREMQPVPQGVAGELYIAGVQLARGYHGRPELTAERFVPAPAGEPGARLYRTGDLARWLADGAIDYLGRVDFQVKVRGFRIELGEIESALAEHPGVREAAVLARADGAPGDLRLVAYVVPAGPAGNTEPEAPALRAFLKDRLPEYMIPAHFLVLEALPLTPSGKVDRKSLPAPDGPRRSETELVPPQGPVEEKVAAIWAEVLRLDRVGGQENFFELGGHSLLATQVLSRVQETFNMELPLRAFFEAPTVAGLAQAIFENEVQQADADLLAELLANLEQQATQGDEND